jgi:hypothetical protein
MNITEAGVDGLEFTRNWLQRAKKRIQDCETIGLFKCESGVTPSAIVNEAFMEIFIWTSNQDFPEVYFYQCFLFSNVFFCYSKSLYTFQIN